ncbi:MAG: HTH domain-containing protein [Phycisphaerae bacterium]|nr:HTH domain-containing protein [Phycisphaerae bacterium]
MAGQLSARSDFTETFAIHVALRSTLKSKQYDGNAAVRKAAESLCKELESERSIYGRQLKMINLMEKGTTIEELGKKLRCSRRTVFRYLNNLEDAGVSITLEDGKYVVDKSVVKMLRV